MLTFKTKTAQIQKLPFFIVWQLLVVVIIQFTLGFIVLPVARAQVNFDKDAYDTLLEDSDKRIKDQKKRRLQRDADLLREEAEAKKADDLRSKRPLFGSRMVYSDDSDDHDENKNKIFETSVKKRDRDRQMNVTLRLDVDDDDLLDSMKPDRIAKKDKEEEKEKAEKERDEDRELVKRREERKEVFDKLTDRPYFVMDWVPSDPDSTSNGGFGILNGNGRPVPYNLNGFPNVQRILPWEIGN